MFLRNLIKGIFVDQFKIVYWLIAAATAQHTAWGAATTMQGAQGEGSAVWWLQGLAFAIAIDISMVMVAIKMRSGSNRNAIRYAITFAVVAILSSYFQLIYAWAHITMLAPGGGVAIDWLQRLQSIIDARLVIAPFALPGISILYTIAGLGRGGEIAKVRNPRNVDAMRVEIGLPELAQPVRPQLLPGAIQKRNEAGELQGYICPACNKELSISGWSRHKKTCPQYTALAASVNGHDEHIQ